MATDKVFMEALEGRLKGCGDIRYKSMFGEYGFYFEEKFIAAICDNSFFIKPTQAGRDFIGNPLEAPPYPGAKMYFAIDIDAVSDKWLCELITRTAAELPEPKPKKKKKS